MNERRMQRRFRKLTATFALISVGLLLIGAMASAWLDKVYGQEIDIRMVAAAERYKTDIDRKVEADIRNLYTLAAFIDFSSTMDVQNLAERLLESNEKSKFSRMGYFETEGSGVRVTIGGKIEADTEAQKMDPALYKAVQKAWKGEEAVTDVYYDENLKASFVGFAVPVQEKGRVVGALTASERVETFYEILEGRGAFNGAESVWLVTDDGSLVGSSEQVKSEFYGRTILDEDLALSKNLEKLKESARQGQGQFFEISIGREDYPAYVEPTRIPSWQILYVTNNRGVSNSLYQNMAITKGVLYSVVLLMAVCLLLGYRLLQRNRRELVRYAYYDPLTGACNMIKFSHMLEEVISGGEGFSVAALNVHKFKFINELFGNEAANGFLRDIKKILEDALGEDEFFCRETADKFYILLRSTDKGEIRRRLEGIAEAIAEAFSKRHQRYKVALYLGVLVSDELEEEKLQGEKVMTHVLYALDKARRADRDEIWFYDAELHKGELLQNYIGTHMQQALKEKEFQLYLQPKVDQKTDRLTGAEALVRWITPGGSMLFPDQFIPMFETNGFCVRLDRYMVEMACAQIRAWLDEGKEAVPISVNQSKMAFYQKGYAEILAAVARKYEVPTEMITLEILESAALDNAEEFNDRICRLREKGFKISMDDFGNGYSSLNTLSSLDIDELKLDRVFLLETSGRKKWKNRLVMEQIAELARKMKIKTVAEGVENLEHEELIRQVGCDIGQGYYYSRPISAEEFTKKYL